VEAFPEDSRMQVVAAEMALSETAFCVERADGDHDLRWFSPTAEVDLCGHATLATAHLLGGRARFHTRSGVLHCSADDGGLVRMDFPSDPPVPCQPPAGLGLSGVVAFARCRQDVLVELTEAASVRRMVPDLAALAALGSRGVVVTAAGDHPGIDCVSRFFAPNAGVPEDPVTGSAHCALAVWWGERLGCDSLVGEQASSRGGTVWMRRRAERVELRGRAVTVSRVSMLV
jgi:predicted PhzF superfamily epimerase YddE/YHI9